MIYYVNYYNSPIGKITMGSDSRSLIGLWFESQNIIKKNFDTQQKDLPIFDDTKEWLDLYFSGKKPNFTPTIRLQGTEFRLLVWEILKQIPYGETTTYGEIAKEIAKLRGLPQISAQAVGCAVGHNPVSIIIPCHRVIGKNGNLTGYAGGLEIKQFLLNCEKRI